MEIMVRDGEPASYAGPALVVAVTAGEAPLSPGAAALDAALHGAITRVRSASGATALGETTLLDTLGRLPAERIIVVGLGAAATLSAADVRKAAASAARAARKAGLDSFGSTVYGHDQLSEQAAAQAITEGSLLGLYRFDRYRVHEPSEVRDVTLLLGSHERGAVEKGVDRGRDIASGVALARDLINEPPNVLTPTELAVRARNLAGEMGLECTVLDREAMRDLGMNALLGVADGSAEPPAFIVLRYAPAHAGTPPLGLVGKGITFDSGGISLKPAENMHHMKGDMGGAAAVLGAMRAIAGLKLDLPVTAVVPSTENLLGERAQTPGDIVRAMNGVTIEIINTDAEGRLILADALSWSVREKLSPMIDVATLTGACDVALGPIYTGVFSNHDATASALLDAADRTGEKMWRLPLDPAFDELIKSDVADIKNQAGRPGGAITAAMFLQRFVGGTPWVHLDIAPTFWSDEDKDEQTKGGTGVAVRTLVGLAEHLASERASTQNPG